MTRLPEKKYTHTTSGHEVIEFDCVEDIEAILKQIWPTGWIPVHELFERFNISNPLVANAFRAEMGLNTIKYKVADLADFIWDSSNIGIAEQNDD
jgi:hypothetical protein